MVNYKGGVNEANQRVQGLSMSRVTLRCIEIRLDIPADEYVRLYQGVVKNVLTKAVDGRNIQFPARILQPFVGHQGVQGHFLIYFDESGKFAKIERLR